MKPLIMGIGLVILFTGLLIAQSDTFTYIRQQETLNEDLSEIAKYIALNSVDDEEYGLGNFVFNETLFKEKVRESLSFLRTLYSDKELSFFVVGFHEKGSFVATSQSDLKSETMFKNIDYDGGISSEGEFSFGVLQLRSVPVLERDTFLASIGYNSGSKNKFYSEYMKNTYGLELDGFSQGVYIYVKFKTTRPFEGIVVHRSDRFTFSNSWE